MEKKLGALTLILLLLTNNANAQATHAPPPVNHRTRYAANAGNGIVPYYTLISSIHGTCTIDGDQVWVSGAVSGDCTYAKITVTLQYNTSGTWHNSSSWSETGTKSATKAASANATPGTLYRAKIVGYVSNGETNETETLYTKVVGA